MKRLKRDKQCKGLRWDGKKWIRCSEPAGHWLFALKVDPTLSVPRRLSNPTAVEFVEDSWAWVRSCDESVDQGKMSEQERSLLIRATLADALAWIERKQ